MLHSGSLVLQRGLGLRIGCRETYGKGLAGKIRQFERKYSRVGLPQKRASMLGVFSNICGLKNNS